MKVGDRVRCGNGNYVGTVVGQPDGDPIVETDDGRVDVYYKSDVHQVQEELK